MQAPACGPCGLLRWSRHCCGAMLLSVGKMVGGVQGSNLGGWSSRLRWVRAGDVDGDEACVEVF